MMKTLMPLEVWLPMRDFLEESRIWLILDFCLEALFWESPLSL